MGASLAQAIYPFRERFIEPGIDFIPAVAWVMDEAGIWPGDKLIPVVTLILMELKVALDDQFVYKDLWPEKVFPGGNFSVSSKNRAT